MTLKEQLIRFVAEKVLERSGRKRSLVEWASRLSETQAVVEGRAAAVKNPERARRALRHMTGLERWGQSRLRVFLGAPLMMDEYDGYRPDETLTMAEQIDAFRAARTETLALVRRLGEAEVPDSQTVPHNQFGPLSVRGWLSYLDGHATRESMRLR